MDAKLRDDLIRKVVWRVLYATATVTVVPAVRLKVIRKGKIPRRGPVLLVSNHPSPWDPMIVPWSMVRQVHNLGTDQLLRVPYFGWMMPYFSMIPFKKGMKDKSALIEVERRIRKGDCVLIFAEGDRTWTGRSNPVKPGTGRLAKRLGVPVGFVRVRNGHLQWPRWATYPRTIPIELEILGTKTYGPGVEAEEINADIARHISVDPLEITAPPRSFGTRLAEGLPKFMWACPHCFHQDGLSVPVHDPDTVNCHACGAHWRVDLSCWLRAESGPAEDMHIEHAHRGLIEHFGELPVIDPERWQADGVALEGEVELSRIHFGQVEAEKLGLGHLELLEDRLRFTDHRGHPPVELPFEPIAAVLMQVGNVLQLRTREENLQITPTIHSTNMWKHFIDRHLRRYRARQQSFGG